MRYEETKHTFVIYLSWGNSFFLKMQQDMANIHERCHFLSVGEGEWWTMKSQWEEGSIVLLSTLVGGMLECVFVWRKEEEMKDLRNIHVGGIQAMSALLRWE